MKWREIESVAELRPGDVISNKTTGEVFVVSQAENNLAVAVRAVVLTSVFAAAGWRVQRPDHEPVSWAEGREP